MFSGIVEEIGIVERIERFGIAPLTVRCSTVLERTRIGDSIAVNGVCLTVAALGERSFTAHLQPITSLRSNLGSLRVGDAVNLERALAVGERIGGHDVQGHVDATGRVVSSTRSGAAVIVRIAAPPEVLRYIVERGFIAVDGASLTVARLRPDGFDVSLVHHTQAAITLSRKQPGAVVNLEGDVIARYVERFAEESKSGGLTLSLLRKSGFA